MRLTAAQLNRATLARQLLLRREPVDVAAGVRRVVALQAQEPASPYVALWNRLADFDPARLDAAFADGAVVKASLMRITLHAVAAEDYPHFHSAMVPSLRAARLGDRRFLATGLAVDAVEGLVEELVEYAATPRTKAELEALLAARLGQVPEPGAWWALRTFAPLVHAPTGGAWSFGRRPSFVSARAEPVREGRNACVRRLVVRYLEGFGPASVPDVAQFTLLPRTVTRTALAELGETVVRLEGPEGVELFDVPDGPMPTEGTSAPARLLGMWDSTLLAYADRSRMIPPDYRRLVIRQNGDVLPTMLVDGYVAGVWRPVPDGIEATAFAPLSDGNWSQLAGEARELVAFLAGREPAVYARYGHWWAKLPTTDARVLP